jgi:hypothetical protein
MTHTLCWLYGELREALSLVAYRVRWWYTGHPHGTS